MTEGADPPLGALSGLTNAILSGLPRKCAPDDLLLLTMIVVTLSEERKDRMGMLAALVYLLLAGET